MLACNRSRDVLDFAVMSGEIQHVQLLTTQPILPTSSTWRIIPDTEDDKSVRHSRTRHNRLCYDGWCVGHRQARGDVRGNRGIARYRLRSSNTVTARHSLASSRSAPATVRCISRRSNDPVARQAISSVAVHDLYARRLLPAFDEHDIIWYAHSDGLRSSAPSEDVRAS